MKHKEGINFVEQNNVFSEEEIRQFTGNHQISPSYYSPRPQIVKPPRSLARRFFRKIGKLALTAAIFIFAIVFIASYNPIFSKESLSMNFGKINIIEQVKHLVTSSDKKISGEEQDRVNILLLGMGGKDHEGGLLTDTIMLASIKPSIGQASLISIPRDLNVEIPGYGWRKINSVHALKEMAGLDGGEETKKFISNLLGIPIQYYAKIDFDGFEQVIDSFGGVDVYVDNTVEDHTYPIRGNENVWPIENRYETLRIEKGWQHFDGKMALKYARSRHAMGIEGSDYARARRQQNVIMSLKKKILSLNNILNPYRISKALDAVKDNMSTDMEIWEILRLSKLAEKIDRNSIITKVIDDSPNGLLYADNINGAFVLMPKSGNFSEIQDMVKGVFSSADIAKKNANGIKIEIQNGTSINGLAYQTSTQLEDLDFNVIKIGNAARQDYEKTVIYDLTMGKDPTTLEFLRNTLEANVSVNFPKWLKESVNPDFPSGENMPMEEEGADIESKADFLIILGSDIANNGISAAIN